MIRLLTALLLSLSVATARDTGDKGMGENVPDKADEVTILKVQILLDGAGFGPGKVDGALGEFTYKAVVNYNFSKGRENLRDWTPVVQEANEKVLEPYARMTVTEAMSGFVNPALPSKPDGWAKQKYMAYRSLLELIAERFHTDENFITKLNPEINLNTLKPGSEVVVPNIMQPFLIEELKAFAKYEADPALSSNTVVIDTHERIAVFYNAQNQMLGAFVITPGKEEFIPRGDWKVVNMATTPHFRYDKNFLEKGERSNTAFQIPPGPNSPVGIFWAGLSKSGIGLHGTSSPRTIGRTESAGCVRFANWDVVRLPTLIRPGARVIVR
jgi:lipoprotein-anchoring transpeptidase ErfK/SrfK